MGLLDSILGGAGGDGSPIGAITDLLGQQQGGLGGLLGASQGQLDASAWVAIAATLFATINIAGGFLVTRRMLAMFRK